MVCIIILQKSFFKFYHPSFLPSLPPFPSLPPSIKVPCARCLNHTDNSRDCDCETGTTSAGGGGSEEEEEDNTPTLTDMFKADIRLNFSLLRTLVSHSLLQLYTIHYLLHPSLHTSLSPSLTLSSKGEIKSLDLTVVGCHPGYRYNEISGVCECDTTNNNILRCDDNNRYLYLRVSDDVIMMS